VKTQPSNWLRITTRRKGRCVRCGQPIPKGVEAFYNPAFGTLAHTICQPPT
jgi:hypothetical protein